MHLLVSGATATIRKYADHPQIGVLMTPRALGAYRVTDKRAADNNCFVRLDKPAYVAMLRALAKLDPLPWWVVAPDVVADARGTLLRFSKWASVLEYYGLPIAFVAQDGQEALPVPWDRIRCLFIGGSTKWKMSEHVARLIDQAKCRDKWVHVGRVNSIQRARYCAALGADSIDGSQFSMFPDRWIPWILPHLEVQQHAMKEFLL